MSQTAFAAKVHASLHDLSLYQQRIYIIGRVLGLFHPAADTTQRQRLYLFAFFARFHFDQSRQFFEHGFELGLALIFCRVALFGRVRDFLRLEHDLTGPGKLEL